MEDKFQTHNNNFVDKHALAPDSSASLEEIKHYNSSADGKSFCPRVLALSSYLRNSRWYVLGKDGKTIYDEHYAALIIDDSEKVKLVYFQIMQNDNPNPILNVTCHSEAGRRLKVYVTGSQKDRSKRAYSGMEVLRDHNNNANLGKTIALLENLVSVQKENQCSEEKSRQGQQILRQNLLGLDPQCAFCKTKCLNVLEVCHILPHCVTGSMKKEDVLLLCANCHLLFDDVEISVNGNLLVGSKRAWDTAVPLKGHFGTKIILNHLQEEVVNIAHMNTHYDVFQSAKKNKKIVLQEKAKELMEQLAEKSLSLAVSQTPQPRNSTLKRGMKDECLDQHLSNKKQKTEHLNNNNSINDVAKKRILANITQEPANRAPLHLGSGIYFERPLTAATHQSAHSEYKENEGNIAELSFRSSTSVLKTTVAEQRTPEKKILPTVSTNKAQQVTPTKKAPIKEENPMDAIMRSLTNSPCGHK